jgi:hypothetical protein
MGVCVYYSINGLSLPHALYIYFQAKGMGVSPKICSFSGILIYIVSTDETSSGMAVQ